MTKTGIDDLRARLDAAALDAWRALGQRRCPTPPTLHLPAPFAEVLQRACALEDLDGGDPERARRLLDHYLTWMPGRRVEQLCADEGVHARIFHAPLDWDAMPRLSGALQAAFDLLADAEVPATDPLGAADPDALKAISPTLAALYRRTYFGGFMPMLGASQVDLDALTDEIDAHGVAQVIDRRMTAPLVHEWMHFGRDRSPLWPPYLDECVAGFLGLVVHKGTAFPPPDEDTGMYGTPWLAQVGAALGRAAGLKALVRAQAGVDPWEDALPTGLLDAAQRLGWARVEATRHAHFLSDTANPWPWVRLFLSAGAGVDPSAITWEGLDAGGPAIEDPRPSPLDPFLVACALETMTLAAHQTPGGAFRVTRALPSGTIILDAALGRCHIQRDPDGSGLEGVEIAPPAFFLPPPVCGQLRRQGMSRVALVLHDLGCIPYVSDLLLEGRLVVGAGEGFEVRRVEGGEG